jgi:hypothetical protein
MLYRSPQPFRLNSMHAFGPPYNIAADILDTIGEYVEVL